MAITKKPELMELISERTEFSKKDTVEFYDALTEIVAEQLEGLALDEVVILPKLCKFSAVERGARMGVNPQNPEQKIEIPARKALKVSTFPSLKDLVKEVL